MVNARPCGLWFGSAVFFTLLDSPFVDSTFGASIFHLTLLKTVVFVGLLAGFHHHDVHGFLAVRPVRLVHSDVLLVPHLRHRADAQRHFQRHFERPNGELNNWFSSLLLT